MGEYLNFDPTHPYLVSFSDVLQDFVVTDFVHVPEHLHPVRSLDTDERLRERHGTETPIEEEQPSVVVDVKKSSNIEVVR